MAENGKNHHEQLDRFEDPCQGKAGDCHDDGDEGHPKDELGGRDDENDRHHEYERADELGSRVKPMDGGVGVVVLADRDPERHLAHLPGGRGAGGDGGDQCVLGERVAKRLRPVLLKREGEPQRGW